MDNIDKKMTNETSDAQRNLFPNIEWIGSGANGVAVECRPGVVCKYTDDPKEVAAAQEVMEIGGESGCVQVYDVQEIQSSPTIWSIQIERCKPLSKTESAVYEALRYHPDDTQQYLHHLGIHASDEEIDYMRTRFNDMIRKIHSSGLSAQDAHTENVGWNRNGDLVLLDLGGSWEKGQQE